MSYLQIYTVDSNGDMHGDKEFRNSHGFAIQVWGYLVKKYKEQLFPDDPITRTVYRDMFEETNVLFDNWESLKMKDWEFRTLMLAYDNALLHSSKFKEMSEALRKFEDAHWLPNRVNHCKGLADRIDELSKDDDVKGLGLFLTSIIDCPWVVYDDNDDIRPFNVNKDKPCWWIDEHEKWNP